jgi:hypothetical protein
MMLEQHAVQEHKRRQTLAALGDTSALLAGDAYTTSTATTYTYFLSVHYVQSNAHRCMCKCLV